MGETITDSQGFFEISGSNAEMTPIDPKINIYHDCNDGWWVRIELLLYNSINLLIIQRNQIQYFKNFL